MKTLHPVSRRNALKLGAAAAALPLVHIRTAGAAGKVSIGFWDHWVPAGNDVMKKQVAEWSDKNKVEVQADFITSNNNKLLLTAAAEAQAGTGHDAIALQTWEVQNHIDKLEPMDDVVGRLTAKYGPANKVCEYLGQVEGTLDGGADQLGHADQGSVRPHQRVEGQGWPRCASRCTRTSRGTPPRPTTGRMTRC